MRAFRFGTNGWELPRSAEYSAVASQSVPLRCCDNTSVLGLRLLICHSATVFPSTSLPSLPNAMVVGAGDTLAG
ncbi:Uncharacterised protein [Mycobacteroides abscessus subsp. abscessus]|nr:Uncharacterised protein [Mycobacteroides abscessus subsp. abscessus]